MPGSTLARLVSLAVAGFALFGANAADACTTILIGKSLTADGSVIHAHNEDMGNEAVGRLWTVEPSSPAQDETLRVPYIELPKTPTYRYWASGNAQGAVGLGTSEQVRPFDSVLVGLNEMGVAMSCNWAHSREENREGKGIRRYAIRQLLLERATSARHGVEIIGDLISEHGQADWGGLIYHLADPREAWVVETTTYNWVARRVRDDEIRVTANRFRIGSDYDLASDTLIRHAVEREWIDSPTATIDFSAVYGQPDKMDQAYDTRREERALELLREKSGVITPEDLLIVLRDRYEGTEHFTPPQQDPVWREDLDQKPELSRTISTNLAQSAFVAHLRGHLPVSIGAVMWYGVATPSYAGFFPLYAGGGSLPDAYSSSDLEDSEESAWWLFRRLQRAADREYGRSYPAILNFWNSHQAVALEHQRRIEKKALELFESTNQDVECDLDDGSHCDNELEAKKLLSAFSFSQAEQALYHARRLLQSHTD